MYGPQITVDSAFAYVRLCDSAGKFKEVYVEINRRGIDGYKLNDNDNQFNFIMDTNKSGECFAPPGFYIPDQNGQIPNPDSNIH